MNPLYHFSDDPYISQFAPRPSPNPGVQVDGDVEIRIVPSLWPLWNAVVDSTLQFSMIRMRNAQPHGNNG